MAVKRKSLGLIPEQGSTIGNRDSLRTKRFYLFIYFKILFIFLLINRENFFGHVNPTRGKLPGDRGIILHGDPAGYVYTSHYKTAQNI